MTTIDMQNEDIRLLILRIFHRLYLISRLCISEKTIADIWESYDNKIAINRAINRNLQ